MLLFSALTTNKNAIWLYILDHTYKALVIEGSGSGKTNTSLNLVNNQLTFDKIYLCAKHPYEAKYQLLINKCKSVGLKHIELLDTQMMWVIFMKMLMNII